MFGAVEALLDLLQVVGLFGSVAEGEDFGLHFQCGKRAAQFVGSIGGKALFAFDAGLNAGEQAVEGVDQGLGFLRYGAADGGKVVGAAFGQF